MKGPMRDCPDHFVGAERLRCDTCGWNAATLSYDRTGRFAAWWRRRVCDDAANLWPDLTPWEES